MLNNIGLRKRLVAQKNSKALEKKAERSAKNVVKQWKKQGFEDNLGKDMKTKFASLEKLIIPLLIKLAKSPEAYIHWPNRAEVIEAQVKKIIAITRG